MSSSIDPEGTEVTVIHELVDFLGADVLEVGCGDGRLTWRYAEAAATVLAMDMNGEKIERATAATPASLLSKTSFVVADIADVELSRTPTTWPSSPTLCDALNWRAWSTP